MTATKKRLTGHSILAAQKDSIRNEPSVTEDNYFSELSSALQWYTLTAKDKQLRNFVLEYFTKLSKKAEVIAINRASDYEIRQLSIISRLDTRGQYLSDKHRQFITDTATALVEKYKNVKEKTVVVEAPTNVVSIQERIEEKARSLAGDIEGAIDDFIINKTEFSAKKFLLANSVAAVVAKKIGDRFAPKLNELHEVLEGTDKQLTEGYSNYTKRELKSLVKFIEEIVADCQQQVQTAKASRAPRKRKAAPPSKVVGKLKYMREFAEFKLKSVKPEDILAASELWVYNTKYRKVQVYRAENGALSVKGTTILGFNIKDSMSMTLRKPQDFFAGLSMGKRALNGALKKLTTKPTTPNGRINEECVLLGAF